MPAAGILLRVLAAALTFTQVSAAPVEYRAPYECVVTEAGECCVWTVDYGPNATYPLGTSPVLTLVLLVALPQVLEVTPAHWD